MKNKFRYWLPEHGGSVNDYYTFETNFDKEDGDWLAEAAAENFHDNHDGWDYSWPVVIVVADELDVIGIFSVEREAVPEFTAYEKK